MIKKPTYKIKDRPKSMLKGIFGKEKNSDWSHDFFQIKEVHELGYRGDGMSIAVIDTGVQCCHNTLKEAFEDGRLIVHDVTTDNDADHTTFGKDQNGHGTWCISRFIGQNDVIGFTPDAKVHSIKALGSGSDDLKNVYKAIELAIKLKVDVISMSLGYDAKTDKTIKRLALKCEEKNIMFFSAAGNDGKNNNIDMPARAHGVISCGSLAKDLSISKFSDRGKQLDLYAPGEDVLGAFKDNRVVYLEGTSMATPISAACFILVKEYFKKKNKNINYHTLKKIVECM